MYCILLYDRSVHFHIYYICNIHIRISSTREPPASLTFTVGEPAGELTTCGSSGKDNWKWGRPWMAKMSGREFNVYRIWQLPEQTWPFQALCLFSRWRELLEEQSSADSLDLSFGLLPLPLPFVHPLFSVSLSPSPPPTCVPLKKTVTNRILSIKLAFSKSEVKRQRLPLENNRKWSFYENY